MTLIACPECNHNISDKAPSCPQCGVPIGKSAVKANSTVTTQATGKSLKLQRVLSVVLGFIGLIIGIGNHGSTEQAKAGVLILLFAIAWNFTTRIRIWWHHK